MTLLVSVISQFAAFVVTCATLLALSVSKADDIPGNVGMPLRAMSSALSELSSFSALYIYHVLDGLQMSWIYAATNSTKVIKFQSFWNVSDVKLIRNSMSQSGFPADLNSCVSDIVDAGRPKPAPRIWLWRNVAHQPLENSGFAAVGILAFLTCILTFRHVTPFSRIAHGCKRVNGTFAACFDFNQISGPHTITL